MDSNRLSVKTFNVNGMGQVDKRVAIFNKIRKYNCIALLQETHSTPSCENKWKKEWGGQIIFLHGSSNSTGVAILFPHMDYSIVDKIIDNGGRLIIVKVNIDNNSYIISNIYAPTKDHKKDQLDFITMAKPKLLKFENETFFLCGDFNICMNLKLDKQECMSEKNDNPEYRKEVLSILETLNLVDV